MPVLSLNMKSANSLLFLKRTFAIMSNTPAIIYRVVFQTPRYKIKPDPDEIPLWMAYLTVQAAVAIPATVYRWIYEEKVTSIEYELIHAKEKMPKDARK